MKKRELLIGVLAAGALLTSCGSDEEVQEVQEVEMEAPEEQTEEQKQSALFYDLVMDQGIGMSFNRMVTIGKSYCAMEAEAPKTLASMASVTDYVAAGYLTFGDAGIILKAAETAYCPELA